MKKKLLISIFSQAISAVAQWGSAALMVKMGGLSLIGLYGLSTSISSPLNSFFSFGLRGIIVSISSKKEIARLFSFKALSVLFSFLIVIAIVSLQNESFVLLIGFSFAKAIESFGEYWKALLQRAELFSFLLLSNVIYSVLSISGVYLALTFDYGGLGVVLVLCVSRLFQFFFEGLVCWRKKLTISLTLENLRLGFRDIAKNFKKYSFLGGSGVLTALNSNIPKYMIQYFLGLESLGVFVALQYFVTAGANLAVASKNVIMPQLAKKWGEDKKSFYQFLKKSLLITFVCSLLGTLCVWGVGEAVLSLVYNNSFEKYQFLLTIMFVAGSFMYTNSIANAALIVKGVLSAQPIIAGIAGITNLLLCWWLIPLLGNFGAVLSMTVSSFIFLLFTSLLVLYVPKGKSSWHSLKE